MKNNMFGFKPRELKTIIDVISRFPKIETALIFGSRALGNHKQGSDVDIALKGDVKNIYLHIGSILNEETLLPYNFDVMNYEDLSNQDLKEHIDLFGKVIYKNSKRE